MLSGAFADTFCSQGVEFNIASGEFHLHIPHKEKIHLIGEGIATMWTIRALDWKFTQRKKLLKSSQLSIQSAPAIAAVSATEFFADSL